MISNYRYQYNYTCYLHYEWHVQLYISNYDLTFYRIKACYFLFRMDSITLDYNLKEENVKKIYYMQKCFCIPQLRFNEYITSMAKEFLLQVNLNASGNTHSTRQLHVEHHIIEPYLVMKEGKIS